MTVAANHQYQLNRNELLKNILSVLNMGALPRSILIIIIFPFEVVIIIIVRKSLKIKNSSITNPAKFV